MSTLILRTGARILVPLCLVAAIVIYLKGHQSPGGGFVAGLTASIALIVHRMATGASLLKGREPACIGFGLLLAVATGLVPMLLGRGFLRSSHMQWIGYEWASVMAFDLGVMLVVAGTVLGMINALWQEQKA